MSLLLGGTWCNCRGNRRSPKINLGSYLCTLISSEEGSRLELMTSQRIENLTADMTQLSIELHNYRRAGDVLAVPQARGVTAERCELILGCHSEKRERRGTCSFSSSGCKLQIPRFARVDNSKLWKLLPFHAGGLDFFHVDPVGGINAGVAGTAVGGLFAVPASFLEPVERKIRQ